MTVQRAAPRRGELPHSLEHEAQILASIMLDWDACWAAGLHAVLEPEDFFDPGYRLVYRAMLWLHARGEPCALPMVCYALQQLGTIDDADRLLGQGVEPWGVALLYRHYTAAGVIPGARVVVQYAEQRREIDRGAAIVKAAHEGVMDQPIYDRAEYRGVGSDV